MGFFSTMAQGLSTTHPARLEDAPETGWPRVSIAPRTVQVWQCNVERWAGCPVLERAYAVLNEAERARAARLRRPVARAEFIAGRGWLRILLAAALETEGLHCDPKALPLESGRYGKPCLAQHFAAGLAVPEFNVAHARGSVLIALSHAGPVGIDIEYQDEAVEALEIARASFAPAEIAAIEQAATERERLNLFYQLWTRKEAIAKADGRGLQVPLDSFSVVTPEVLGGRTEFSVHVEAGTEPATYYLRVLPVETGFAGAIALTKPQIAVEIAEISATGLISSNEGPALDASSRGNRASVTDWEGSPGQRGMVTAA